MRMGRFTAAFALAAGLAGHTVPAAAQGTLNLYCSVQIEWCQAIANNFQRDSGIRVNMTQRGSGETLAAIRAEGQNPRGDVWFGGTGDPHLAAGEENLTQAYESPNRTQLHPWALRQWEQSGRRAIGVYAGAVGFGYNTELLARKGIEPPRCWSDLVHPRFRGEIQVANPNSSGTAYVIIATLVQLMGEDQAFAYMRELHPNINAYARSGTGPIKAVARGETGISLSFVHDAVTERNAGFPVAYATPCEGTGYEIGSMSIIRGARNMQNAQRFYHWALSAEAQITASREARKLQTMSNRNVPLTDGAPNMATARIIDYDNARFGASAERRRLLARWDREISALAR